MVYLEIDPFDLCGIWSICLYHFVEKGSKSIIIIDTIAIDLQK